jgi:hypothetical protein
MGVSKGSEEHGWGERRRRERRRRRRRRMNLEEHPCPRTKVKVLASTPIPSPLLFLSSSPVIMELLLAPYTVSFLPLSYCQCCST